MNLKTTAFAILSFTIYAVASAQTQTTYYSPTGKRLPGPDSAAYKRIISIADTATPKPMYNITDIYANGKTRLTGKISQPTGTVLEGRCVRYYQNGNIAQIANFTLGMMSGATYDYYSNGKLYRIVQHELQRPAPNSFVEAMPLIKTCNDSTGVALITDGNGLYVGYSDDFKTVTEKGYIKNGLKVGQWHGEIADHRSSLKFKFTESYENGKLNSGKSTDEDGEEHYYTGRSINPVFRGGENAFGLFLRDNIRYPKDAKEQNIQGRVFVSFTVEGNGKLTNYKVQRSPSESLSAEALRVLDLSPEWNPGLWYGHPVKIQFTVPINFSLR